MKVKVRIAPSPTGFLHIGTAQSALYNWLFAKKNDGNFYLRIEDTDKERSTKEYEQSILDALTWLGLQWDGEVIRQSERTDRYRAATEQLLENGKAFYCHHSKEELEAERKSQEDNKQPPRHICGHKNSEEGKKPGGIIRLAVTDRTVSFDDEIRGKIEFEAMLLGDFSIAKSVNEPLYNFAVVVDDSDMEISHVIRGEDHISNTPKQILIYDALGKKVPFFAHLPLILGNDKSKLSKRHSDTAAIGYKKDYLPEAMINFLGCLGYTFSKEILNRDEMAEQFELSKVHKSGAIFDVKKLNWTNSQWIKRLSPKEFKEIVDKSEIPDAAVPLITERLEKLSTVENFNYFWEEPEYEKELLIWKNSTVEQVTKSLEEAKKIVATHEGESIRTALDELGKNLEDRGLAYWPLRVAVTGKEKSPDPVEIISVLGKEKTLARLEKAINKIEN